MKKIKKKANWEILFREWTQKNRSKKFAWGSWDCVIFSNDLIKTMTGTSLLPKDWKTWKSEEEANTAIEKLGKKKGLAEGVSNASKKLDGIYEVQPDYVQKGDLVVYADEDKNNLVGIYDGLAVLAPSSVDGLTVRNDFEILRVWRID